MGVAYLCNFVSGKKVEMPGALQVCTCLDL